MRRRRHRQELGDALHDSEDRCLKRSGHDRADYEARALRCALVLRVGCCGAGGCTAVMLGACAAARVGAVPRQKLTVAAAMKTLEYVPVMIPTTIVNANPWSTSPPKKNRANAVSRAVPDVMTVRPNVWFTDTLITWSIESRRIVRRFSRIRSKITIVSFVEKPVIVRIAAMTLSDMSYRKNARNARVISRSWMVATTAPTPKLNWNRKAR